MVSTKKADEILKNAAVYYPKLYDNAWTVKPTKLYGYPSFKYGNWRVIRKIPTYWGDIFAMVTYDNKFAYLVIDGTPYVVNIYIKRQPKSKVFDLDISYREILTPKEVISLLQTHLPFKDRYWQISLRDNNSLRNCEGNYPQRVKAFLTREV
jgi:hypothetical protein